MTSEATAGWPYSASYVARRAAISILRIVNIACMARAAL
jgi:hypothetical protein